MILVVGATGILGGIITRQLLAQGQTVRILVREHSPSAQLAQQGMATAAQTLIEEGADPVFGDLRDPPSLARAVAGVRTVVSTANSALRGGEDNVETVDRRGNRDLIDAAAAAGVEHFVFVSALGATVDNPVPFNQAKAETEVRLRESGMDYTIIAPNAFMEIWAGMVVGGPALSGQPVTLVGEGRRRHSFISVRDVAAFAVAAVNRPEARNQYLALGGPEAVSWREIVATYEQVLGRELPVKWVAPGDPVPGLVGPMSGLLASQETFDSVVPMDETAAAYEVTLTSVADFARGQVAAAAARV